METRALNVGAHVILYDARHAHLVEGHNWHIRLTNRTQDVFYAHRSVKSEGRSTTLYLHRAIAAEIWGADAIHGKLVDHVNHNGLDNRAENLRIATSVQNGANIRKHVGKSGYRGVYVTPAGTYVAQVGQKKLGTYQCVVEAARARDDAARAKYGAFAVLNFPEIAV